MDAPLSLVSTVSSDSQQQRHVATSPLRALRTETTLAPKNQSQSVRVLSALSRVTSVSISDVVKEDGHRLFVVDIRMGKTLHGLPKPSTRTTTTDNVSITCQGVAPMKLAGSGDVQTKHRFSAFSNLRHELYYHAHTGHRHESKPCVFCARVLDVTTHAPTRPRLHSVFFQTTDALRQQLEAFLLFVVHLATQAKHDPTGCWCEGREMVPLLVKQFLLGNDGEHEASVSSASRPTGWSYTTAWSA